MQKNTTMRNDSIFRRERVEAASGENLGIVVLTRAVLERLYDWYWLPRRIVDLLVDLSMKDGFQEKAAGSAGPVEGPEAEPASTDPLEDPPAEEPGKTDALPPPRGSTPAEGAVELEPELEPSLDPESASEPQSEEDEVYKAFREWNYDEEPDGKLQKAAKRGRLFGGSALVLGFAEPTEKEWVEGTFPELAWIDVATRHQLEVVEVEEDANSPRFKLPTVWRLSAAHIRGPLDIHHSKLIFFPGLTPASDSRSVKDKYWTISVLQPILQSLFGYDEALNGVAQALGRFDVGVLKSKGLFAALSSLNTEEVDARQTVFNDGIRNSRTIFLDPEQLEEYIRLPLNLAGLPEAVGLVRSDLAGGTGFAQTLLFGESPDGFASGDSDRDNTHDLVEAYRMNVLQPAINKMMSAILGREVEIEFGDSNSSGTNKAGNSGGQRPGMDVGERSNSSVRPQNAPGGRLDPRGGRGSQAGLGKPSPRGTSKNSRGVG